jgi:hypothetical protein
MKHRAITEEEFTAALRAVVEERGADYVYPKYDENYTLLDALGFPICQYSTPSGEPACIVGAALAKIDPELVPPYGYMKPAHSVLNDIISEESGFAESPEWVWAARSAQSAQDAGRTWGEALTRYEVARVYEFGSRKYAANNWRKGYEWAKSFAAACRHMFAFWRGEDRDPETGTLHVANAVFHMLTLITFALDRERYGDFDDRYKKGQGR